MKSDFRVESFKRKFSTIFFLMTECSKRNRKNYQRNKKSHARIKLDHGLALVGLRTTGPMPKICFVSECTKKVYEENGMKISFHKFLERETYYRYYPSGFVAVYIRHESMSFSPIGLTFR